jgi:hypothetical protein
MPLKKIRPYIVNFFSGTPLGGTGILKSMALNCDGWVRINAGMPCGKSLCREARGVDLFLRLTQRLISVCNHGIAIHRKRRLAQEIRGQYFQHVYINSLFRNIVHIIPTTVYTMF